MTPLEVTPSDYHAKMRCNRENIFAPDSCLSKSVLWELHKTSLYTWRYHPRKTEPTAAMRWGSLVDCITTTPELAETEVVICPFDSYRTKEAKEWKEANRYKTITTADELEEAQKAARMLTETHKGSAEIFAKSKGQVIVLGRIMGCNVKGLVDLAPDGEDFLADLKTTADFSARGFESTIDKFGYHVQAGLYLALWNTMFPDDKRNAFKFVWQDKAPPYEVAVTELTPSEIDEGLAQAAHLIEKLVNATKANHWPMKFEKEFMVMRPTYAAMREEAERQQEGSEP